MSISRLSLNPSTLLPSVQSFGELSQFLNAALADEESQKMAESMALLAQHIEGIATRLRSQPNPAVLANLLMDLLTVLRQHRNLVIELNSDWRRLYEYAAYFASLSHFRVLAGQWALEATQSGAAALRREDFELVAWRMLGEGALLIDVYEQACYQQMRTEIEEADKETVVERARSWWGKLGP